MKNQSIRLQKYIADCGVTSRRKAEELILKGKVKVNDRVVTELGTKVALEGDVVMVNGEIIDLLSVDHVYLALNKPRSCVTTVHDPEGRKTVMDLVPIKKRVFPVGRLDYLSEGLLLLTNDGDLANMIMHPSFEVTKVYEVKVFGRVNEMLLNKLKAGIVSHDGVLKPKSVRILEQLPQKTWLEFRLNEGKNREIRRICEAAGVTIDKLRRVAIGNLSIDGINPGQWEYITKADLLKKIGINKDGSKRQNAEVYVSTKRSVDVKKGSKKQKNATIADSKDFTKFRKEIYFETLDSIKKTKAISAAKKQEKENK
ncbi:MAG: rRNA pseudouridine synthase [Bacteriovoracaceae bacterium]|nr:rRNA pseudouridine synthase [Bacteriovoracaceae bacterium]